MAAKERLTKQDAIREIEEQHARLIGAVRNMMEESRRVQNEFIEAVTDISTKLHAIARDLPNRSPTKRAPRVSPPITTAIIDHVKRLAAENPTITNHEIAAQLGINQGRVSEILSGRRG